MTDEELFAAFMKGDDASLGALARKHEPALLGLARGLLHGRGEHAADVVQSAWLRVIRYRHTFSGRSTFKTWMYRIVINEARAVSTKIARMKSQDRAFEPTQRDDTADAFEIGAVRAALDELTQGQRETLLLCYHGGISHAQAAAILQIPLGTLKSRLNAALVALRARLDMEVVTS